MMAGAEIRGLICAESDNRLAFTPTDELAASLIAAQFAAVVALAESVEHLKTAGPGSAVALQPSHSGAQSIRIRHFAHDDSLVIDHACLIKSLKGRLLWRMLQTFAQEGRTEFTNREFRLDGTLKRTDFKDNLESRLLFLSRRLAENVGSMRIIRNGRGCVLLEVRTPTEPVEQCRRNRGNGAVLHHRPALRRHVSRRLRTPLTIICQQSGATGRSSAGSPSRPSGSSPRRIARSKDVCCPPPSRCGPMVVNSPRVG
jgi:hypothetical protein